MNKLLENLYETMMDYRIEAFDFFLSAYTVDPEIEIGYVRVSDETNEDSDYDESDFVMEASDILMKMYRYLRRANKTEDGDFANFYTFFQKKGFELFMSFDEEALTQTFIEIDFTKLEELIS